jgi:hypothetical protein
MGVKIMKKMMLMASMYFLFFGGHFSLYGVDSMMHDTTTLPDKPADTLFMREMVKTDTDIKEAVKNAFSSDSRTSAEASKVDVKVDKGVGTLRGSVSSSEVKSDFGAVARGIAGVTHVVNNVSVIVK